VSPGLVQHYFPTKAELRQAVDEYVLQVTAAAFAGLPGPEATSASRVEEIGQRVTALFRERAVGQRYVARGLIDRDERALAIFDALFEMGKQMVEEDMREGRSQPDLDVTWASLHTLVYHFGVVLLEHAIDRHLPEPLRSEPGLERWRRATTELFRQGIFRAD
jgi:AcrR family transcriptional regulator